MLKQRSRPGAFFLGGTLARISFGTWAKALVEHQARAYIGPLTKPTPSQVDMNERQRRSDAVTANAVARGVNIQAVRGTQLAHHYMRSKGVSEAVIERVLAEPALRRSPSSEQAISEAITPSPPEP